MKEKNRYLRWGLTAVLTVCAILVFYDTFYQNGTLQTFFARLMAVLAPVLYGAAMAYLLAPVVNWFSKAIMWCIGKSKKLSSIHIKKGKSFLRAGSILLTWTAVLVIIYFLMSMLMPQLVESVTALVKNLRSYYYKVYRWVDDWLISNPEIGSWANDTLKDYYQDAVGFLTDKILPKAQELAGALTGGIWSGIWGLLNFAKNLVIGLIVSIYLLAMKEQSLARCCKLLYATFKTSTADLIARGTCKVNEIFSGFVRGKILDSAIIGILCLIGCGILKIPYAPLISVIVGITNVIPFFGPFLGAIPSAFLVLLVNPLKCLYFIIFVALLQQLDGNVIGPKILGETTGISSFWVIVAILVGGGFGGILGMFLGVPICACLRCLVKYIMDRRLEKRDMSLNACVYADRAKHTKDK